ncbi:MAG: hypothetical protein KA807_07990 [Prolixibacteraceae bacterium]|jgi:hypothetical protein|nr:hypothetical protein [Prolixibacteraceae bacterium]
MEIGSFLPLDLKISGEHYFDIDNNVGRFNSARAGIFYACGLYGCEIIWVPYYLCQSVSQFLLNHNIKVKYYNIDYNFEPVNIKQSANEAVLLVNYYGIISNQRLQSIAKNYFNIVIDNAASFFTEPLADYYQVYSPRKFFGVPDGCYVVGKDAGLFIKRYKQDKSSSTSLFLLQRFEHKTSTIYEQRMNNEARINSSGILRMSRLSITLLKSIDYKKIKSIRAQNFMLAHKLFGHLNLIDPTKYTSDQCVPMIYPLVTIDSELDEKLRKNRIYVGRLWKSVLNDVTGDSFEAYLSQFMIPIPIDQRYGPREINYCYRIICRLMAGE